MSAYLDNVLGDLRKARAYFHKTGDPSLLALVVDARFELIEELLERKPLELVMGVEEAATMWDLSPGRIKNICNEGRIPAKKVGRTWIVSKLQESPKHKPNKK